MRILLNFITSLQILLKYFDNITLHLTVKSHVYKGIRRFLTYNLSSSILFLNDQLYLSNHFFCSFW